MPRGVPVATVAIGNAENAALLAAQILALVGPGARGPRRRAAPGADRRGAGRPVERGAAAGLTRRRSARDAVGAVRPRARVDSGRWTTNAGSRGCRCSTASRSDAPAVPPACRRASRACRRGACPRPPRRRSRSTTSCCAPRRWSPAPSRSPRWRSARGLGSPLVKLCVLVAAPLLFVTTVDATLRIWRSAWAWMPVDRGKGTVPPGLGRRQPRVPRADRRRDRRGAGGLGVERRLTEDELAFLAAADRGPDGRSTDVASGGGTPPWMARDAALLLPLRRAPGDGGAPRGEPRAPRLRRRAGTSRTSIRASS